MNDEMKIAVLRAALEEILDNETDWKTCVEFGGYVLDDNIRDLAKRALEITE